VRPVNDGLGGGRPFPATTPHSVIERSHQRWERPYFMPVAVNDELGGGRPFISNRKQGH
ncbi:MAG: hypothetical protein GY803_00165, partial [Chloroflexi bacterium]|nr:hypothetical protein [Chloroflexota bacterium]